MNTDASRKDWKMLLVSCFYDPLLASVFKVNILRHYARPKRVLLQS